MLSKIFDFDFDDINTSAHPGPDTGVFHFFRAKGLNIDKF